MKSNLLKTASFITIVVLLLSLFTGCGGSSNNAGTASTGGQSTVGTTAGTSTVPETTKAPDELNVMMFDTYPGASFDNDVMNLTQEKTNTKLNITVSDNLDDKVNVLLASGDRPDMIQYSNDSTEAKLTEAGLLLPINQYFDKTPDLKKYWEPVWPAMVHEDGNIYAIPVFEDLVQICPYYRQDWLTKLNMKAPTTLDEYYNFAVAVATKDPDGNGKNDTYALGGAGGLSDWRFFDHIFGAYGALPALWTEVGGKLVDGATQLGAKEALKFINKLYKAGAIDPEFVTDNWDRTMNKLRSGIYGAPCSRSTVWEPTTSYYTEFHKNVPDGSWVYAGILQGGSPNPVGMRMINRRGWIKTSILKDSKKTDAALRLVNWLASDEGAEATYFGILGKTYEKSSDGKIKLTYDSAKMAQYGIQQCTLAQREVYSAYSDEWINIDKQVNATALANEADLFMIPEKTKYMTLLNDYAKTEFTKMAVGDVPIDGGFENFVKEWNKKGGAELTTALNNAYQKLKSK